MSEIVVRPPTMAEQMAPWVNATGEELPDYVVGRIAAVQRQLSSWVETTRAGSQGPSLFNRAAYKAPDNPYAQMTTARSAADSDDIISGAADVTEGLAFQGVKWEASDPEDADYFNQMSRDLNLDGFVRSWYRDDFIHSQAIVGLWWGEKTYKHRAKTEAGRSSKKSRTFACPVGITLLDPTKVVPLKPGPFGQDRLAWHATEEEFATAKASYDNVFGDAVLREFTTGPITITDKDERDYLTQLGIDVNRLLGLNPYSVFRITKTKASYERFPSLRLKSTFGLLDLKHQLMEADRVMLVGAANYILLVKQGDKDAPATQNEIDNLKDNFKVVAKIPVVIGDHRLSIEIITPEQEHVLETAKYDTIDRRLISRVLGAMSVAGSGQRQESTSGMVTRGVARGLENRRHMLKRALEQQIARAIVEHPANTGKFKDEPNLTYIPQHVQIDNDQAITAAILQLRAQKELSRETVLEYLGFDQAVEAMRREIEADEYDDIFQTQVPFSSPNAGDPHQTGAEGGRPPGGGEPPKSPQGQSGNKAQSGQSSPKKE